MLELDDIQHFLLTRTPALTGRYEFLPSGRRGADGLAGRHRRQGAVGCGGRVRRSTRTSRWVTVAFTWNGLRALGVDEASLATFPEEFQQGMAARAEMLGDTGANHPDHWVGGLASPDLHAIVILFARDVAERERCTAEHQQLVAQCPGVEVLSSLDLEATPPFDYAHDHFGYRDRLSQPVIEGTGEEPTPGSGAPLKAGRVLPRATPTRTASSQPAAARDPLAQRQLPGLSPAGGARRRVSRLPAPARETPEEQELLAAKLMGRWRSGAPLVLAPDKDDPALGADHAAQQRLQLREDGPARLRRARSARTSGA